MSCSYTYETPLFRVFTKINTVKINELFANNYGNEKYLLKPKNDLMKLF